MYVNAILKQGEYTNYMQGRYYLESPCTDISHHIQWNLKNLDTFIIFSPKPKSQFFSANYFFLDFV